MSDFTYENRNVWQEIREKLHKEIDRLLDSNAHFFHENAGRQLEAPLEGLDNQDLKKLLMGYVIENNHLSRKTTEYEKEIEDLEFLIRALQGRGND